MIVTYIKIPKNDIPEGSSFTATAYFRDVNAGTTPTTARYRVDCVTTGQNVRAWTSLTPAESIDIDITPSDNATKSSSTKSERKRITVETNSDLDTQTRKHEFWTVKNISEF